jgi:hydroxyacylglutathione hydrolase
MLLKYFYDDHLAQASYMVGCAETGEALVIDPMRDIAPYLETAAREGLKITHVTETHIHADFVSGIRELAAATGAMMYLSDMGDADWKYAFADAPNAILLRDGDRFMVGNVRVEVLHTPGHTPEHVSFLITDTKAADKPIAMFTGDFIFAGDVGRPDLLEEAAGIVGTKEPGARALFASLKRLSDLPDYLQLLPGHGAGSACGKALGAIPSTTLGYERLFNPAFQFTDEAAFVAWLLDGQPDAPRYFAQMKRVNKQGAALVRDLPEARPLGRAALDGLLADGAFVIDLRPAAAFTAHHVPGTINIPATSRTWTTYVGWLVRYDAPLYFIAPDAHSVPELLTALRAIGVDNVPGWFPPDVVHESDPALPVISPAELADRLTWGGVQIIDVRSAAEHCAQHIDGSRNIPLGSLAGQIGSLPTDTLLVTQCASGYRSQIAASLLRAHGLTQVVNLNAGQAAWSQIMPTAACPA